MKRRLGLATLALIMGACFSSTAGGLSYELTEFAIDGSTTLQAGESALHLVNNGEFTHTFVITDEDGEVVAASDVLAPGQETELNVDLINGKYMISCRLVIQTDDGGLVDHFEQGMILPLEVTG